MAELILSFAFLLHGGVNLSRFSHIFPTQSQAGESRTGNFIISCLDFIRLGNLMRWCKWEIIQGLIAQYVVESLEASPQF